MFTHNNQKKLVKKPPKADPDGPFAAELKKAFPGILAGRIDYLGAIANSSIKQAIKVEKEWRAENAPPTPKATPSKPKSTLSKAPEKPKHDMKTWNNSYMWDYGWDLSTEEGRVVFAKYEGYARSLEVREAEFAAEVRARKERKERNERKG